MKSLKLCAIALLTTAMTALPAYALSLNLGGEGPLVDLGNDSNADATVSVDTGNLLGGNSSGGTNADATVDINLGDIGGDGSLDSVIDDDGDGGLINLGGDADLIDLNGNGDSVIDLGGDGNLLDLGGTDSLVDLADVDLGGSGNLLDLGNDGDLLDLGNGPLLDLGTNPESRALIEADLGGGDLLDFGETGGILDPGGAGNLLDLGGNGNGFGGGSGGPAIGNGAGGIDGGSGGGLLASASTDAGVNAGADACLTLDAAELDQLIQRHIYNRATFNSWASAQSLKIVEVDFCDVAVADVAAAASGSANVASLQAFLAAQAKVNAGLQSKGYSAGDVIAADHSGEVLIVYVI